MNRAGEIRRSLFRMSAAGGGQLIGRLLRVWARTWKLQIEGAHHLEEIRRQGRGVLYCLWHGRMLELVVAHADMDVGVLVSDHPDGVAAARILDPLGYVPIPFSKRNAVEGVRRMLRHADEGGDLAITPDAHSDGHRVLPGVVAIASRTGHALLPVAASARPCKRVESWDRFEIPWPRADVRIRYGEPVLVPDRADPATREEARLRLESSLRSLHRALEDEFDGRTDRTETRRAALST